MTALGHRHRRCIIHVSTTATTTCISTSQKFCSRWALVPRIELKDPPDPQTKNHESRMESEHVGRQDSEGEFRIHIPCILFVKLIEPLYSKPEHHWYLCILFRPPAICPTRTQPRATEIRSNDVRYLADLAGFTRLTSAQLGTSRVLTHAFVDHSCRFFEVYAKIFL